MLLIKILKHLGQIIRIKLYTSFAYETQFWTNSKIVIINILKNLRFVHFILREEYKERNLLDVKKEIIKLFRQ